MRLSTSRGRWQSQRVRLEYATIAPGQSRRGHAVLAHELGSMNRSSDVFYDLKTLLQARRPLERLAYADLLRRDWGLLRDIRPPRPRTSLPRGGAVIRAAESAIKREWAKLSSVNGAAVLYHCAVYFIESGKYTGNDDLLLQFFNDEDNQFLKPSHKWNGRKPRIAESRTQNFGEFAASKWAISRPNLSTKVPNEQGASLIHACVRRRLALAC